MIELDEKYGALKAYLASLGSVLVAFSGGVDSTFLLYAAKEALGDRVAAVTAGAPFVPQRELNEAKMFCEKLGVRQYICKMDIATIPNFTVNPKDRCYHCKKAIFSEFKALAGKLNIKAVTDGSNLDDIGDYRPGARAIAELQILSPLRICGFSKEDIRILSRKYQLYTWNKPSFACLASRFPYGEIITEEKLKQVETAEQILRTMGFKQMRVRVHGNLARIEILPEDMEKFMYDACREKVAKEFKQLGFTYTALDISGYRTGSMNETLTEREKSENTHL